MTPESKIKRVTYGARSENRLLANSSPPEPSPATPATSQSPTRSRKKRVIDMVAGMLHDFSPSRDTRIVY